MRNYESSLALAGIRMDVSEGSVVKNSKLLLRKDRCVYLYTPHQFAITAVNSQNGEKKWNYPNQDEQKFTVLRIDGKVLSARLAPEWERIDGVTFRIAYRMEAVLVGKHGEPGRKRKRKKEKDPAGELYALGLPFHTRGECYLADAVAENCGGFAIPGDSLWAFPTKCAAQLFGLITLGLKAGTKKFFSILRANCAKQYRSFSGDWARSLIAEQSRTAKDKPVTDPSTNENPEEDVLVSLVARGVVSDKQPWMYVFLPREIVGGMGFRQRVNNHPTNFTIAIPNSACIALYQQERRTPNSKRDGQYKDDILYIQPNKMFEIS